MSAVTPSEPNSTDKAEPQCERRPDGPARAFDRRFNCTWPPPVTMATLAAENERLRAENAALRAQPPLLIDTEQARELREALEASNITLGLLVSGAHHRERASGDHQHEHPEEDWTKCFGYACRVARERITAVRSLLSRPTVTR